MGPPQRGVRFTAQEYYLRERDAVTKSEYFDGEIFAMASASAAHVLIATNLASELGNRLIDSPCAAFGSDLRVLVEASGLRTYPDVTVACAELQRDPEDSTGQTYTNPTVVFEVLSRTTEAYDRGFKAENYRRIPSLQAYVLVAQDAFRVDLFERQADGRWLFTEIKGEEQSVPLSVLGISLPLRGIYAKLAITGSSIPRRP